MNKIFYSKSLKYETLGFLPFKSSYGVLFRMGLTIALFRMWYTVLLAFAQNFLGKQLSARIVLVILVRTLFFLSTTPFYSGVLGEEY